MCWPRGAPVGSASPLPRGREPLAPSPAANGVRTRRHARSPPPASGALHGPQPHRRGGPDVCKRPRVIGLTWTRFTRTLMPPLQRTCRRRASEPAAPAGMTLHTRGGDPSPPPPHPTPAPHRRAAAQRCPRPGRRRRREGPRGDSAAPRRRVPPGVPPPRPRPAPTPPGPRPSSAFPRPLRQLPPRPPPTLAARGPRLSPLAGPGPLGPTSAPGPRPSVGPPGPVPLSSPGPDASQAPALLGLPQTCISPRPSVGPPGSDPLSPRAPAPLSAPGHRLGPPSPPGPPSAPAADSGRPRSPRSPSQPLRGPGPPPRHPPKVRRCLKVFSDGMAREARRRVPAVPDGGGGGDSDCGDSDFPCVSSGRSRVR